MRRRRNNSAVLTTTITTTLLPIEKNPITKKITIEICIHTFHYQKRLCWMLSSILQQKGDLPNIIINISHTENDGIPTTAEVCKFFKDKGLNIKELIMPKEQVSNRAIARNIQVKQTIADWILFVDSDMVYDPWFFDDLQRQLKNELRNEYKVMGADRISLQDEFCIKYFQEDKTIYPCIIENVADKVSKWPVKWVTGKHKAPGNFQLAKVAAIVAKGNCYSGVKRDFWRHTKSDRAFRIQMGGNVGIKVKPQYHLNHDRGGPEVQR